MEKLLPVTEPETSAARIKSKFRYPIFLITELHVVYIIYCLIIVYMSVTLVSPTITVSSVLYSA